MKSVLLIGMGKFGTTLGERLLAMGNDVVIVDKKEEIIDSLAQKYENAIITDCMLFDNLKALDVPSYDVCIVTIGENFQASLEITSNLKDLGAKRVISKAATEIQRKFLIRTGADEVIYPDRDIAEKLAVKINSTNVINFVDLDSEFSIFEIAVPSKWVKKKLVEINPRKQYDMNILIVKRGDTVFPTLDGEFVFEGDDQLVVFGNSAKILAFTNKQKSKKK